MLITDININPLLHSRTRFLIVLLLLQEEQGIAAIASKLNIIQTELDPQLSLLQKAGYIEAKKDIWKSCLQTIFSITDAGIASLQEYTEEIEKTAFWVKSRCGVLQKPLCIITEGKKIYLELNNIQYIKSCGNYIKVITQKSMYISQMTTKKIEKLLADSLFLRIHKSYIVNTTKIISVSDTYLKLEKATLPIGKTFKKLIQQMIN